MFHPTRAIAPRALLVPILAVALTGCYRVRSELVSAPSPSPDLYRCAQLHLGRSGYAIIDADGASGWLHAEKRINSFPETKRAEIYLTVIPEDEGGSYLLLTDNSHAEGDADALRAECTDGGGEVAPRGTT